MYLYTGVGTFLIKFVYGDNSDDDDEEPEEVIDGVIGADPLGELRHKGQEPFIFSHSSMQSV